MRKYWITIGTTQETVKTFRILMADCCGMKYFFCPWLGRNWSFKIDDYDAAVDILDRYGSVVTAMGPE